MAEIPKRFGALARDEGGVMGMSTTLVSAMTTRHAVASARASWTFGMPCAALSTINGHKAYGTRRPGDRTT